MQRYFVPVDQWSNEEVTLRADQAHHVQRVMRMSVDDKIVCLDNEGRAAICRITSSQKDEVNTVIEQFIVKENELPVRTTVVQGDLKADKLELVIQKCTELGVDNVITYPAERSIVKWDEKKLGKKMIRYQKIASEAAEQSERLKTPGIARVSNRTELLDRLKTKPNKWLFSEHEAKTGRHEHLAKTMPLVQADEEIILLFGPEGGFSAQEQQIFIDAGCTPMSLGPRILRAETAPIAAMGMLVYHFELVR